GNRAHGGRGGAGLAARSGSRDHVHGRAEPAHGLAKGRGLDSAHRRGPHNREGTIHGVVGALVEPAHGIILACTLVDLLMPSYAATDACPMIEVHGSRGQLFGRPSPARWSILVV